MGEHESNQDTSGQQLTQRLSSLGGLLSDLASVPGNVSEILRVVRKLLHIQEAQVAAIDDLNQAVADLQSEDSLIIQGLDDLAAKVASGGTVTEADINAVKDNVAAEVAKLQTALQTDDPSVVPTPPAPAGP
jgi:uncharacterized phage infection (PIP) family protein YhgE